MKVIEGIFLLCCFTGPLFVHCQPLINQTGCGESIGCFTCTDDRDDCEAGKKYFLTYRKDGDYIEFELSGKNSWVALGFNSKPDSMKEKLFKCLCPTKEKLWESYCKPWAIYGPYMGMVWKGLIRRSECFTSGYFQTDTTMCTTISGKVEIQHYSIGNKKTLPPKTNPVPSQIVLINGTYKDGRTTCRFKRKVDAGGQSGFKSLNTAHYLVFAYGTVVGSQPEIHIWKQTTPKEIDVQVAAKILGGSSIIAAPIKAHGCLMTLAWMCFAAISIFMARYMRLVWEDEKLFGQNVWFTVHRGLMVLVIIFSTIAVILAFVHRGGWSEGIGAHPYTGIITFALALIQPVMAFFRPHPGTDKRFLFNLAHRSVGLSALTLAVVTIFLAVFLKYLSLQTKGLPVLIIFCVGVAILVIFEIFFCIKQDSNKQAGFSPSDSGVNKNHHVEQMQEVPANPSLSSQDRCLRLSLFGFVVLLSMATSLALVIIIAMK